MMQGKIIKGIAGFYYIDVLDKGIYECKARGVFRKKKIVPLVGDIVKIVPEKNNGLKGNIIEILPRKNQLIRPTVSNIDQAIIVFAVINPKPNFSLLDRFLILAGEQNIDVVICFNKIDLLKFDVIEEITSIYRNASYDVMATSTLENIGSQLLSNKLSDKTTVFAGPSGVGKSSILNMLQPTLRLQTGEISDKIKRGKHTTRHAELLALHNGGYVVDTPGFSSLYLNHISYKDLGKYYKEFNEFSCECKFNGCSHIHEPCCGIKNAVQNEQISEMRYKNYVTLYNELKEHEERNKWR